MAPGTTGPPVRGPMMGKVRRRWYGFNRPSLASRTKCYRIYPGRARLGHAAVALARRLAYHCNGYLPVPYAHLQARLGGKASRRCPKGEGCGFDETPMVCAAGRAFRRVCVAGLGQCARAAPAASSRVRARPLAQSCARTARCDPSLEPGAAPGPGTGRSGRAIHGALCGLAAYARGTASPARADPPGP